MNSKRTYQGKDVDMLTTCANIIENALADQPFLVEKRPMWTTAYFDEIKTRIDDAFANYLGIDNASRMRQATQTVLAIQAKALNELSELKVQIEEDFKGDKERRDEILRQLGYTPFYKKTHNRDQEALVQLLYQFNSSLTDELKTEIIAQGSAPQTLENINQYAVQLLQANISQETLKSSRKIIVAEGVTEFTAIYNQVISIAKIARNFHKGNSAMQDRFSYSRILKKLNTVLK